MNRPKKKTDPAPQKEKKDIISPGEASAERAAVEHASESGSVDKIRDILFGNQMRDYNQRFVLLEERILQEIKDLREETRNRLDTMESYIQKEIDSISNRLNMEQKLRAESVEKVTNEFKVEIKAVSESIERLEGQQSQDSRDLRQQLLEQSKNFSNEISKKHEESSATLDRSIQQLRADKIDRTTFSELLMEMAVRVSDDLGTNLNLESSDLK